MEIPLLASGETATLDLTLYPLVENTTLTFYGQVAEVDQEDPDSTPGNGIAPEVSEDDEAVVSNDSDATEGFVANPIGRDNQNIGTAKLYPVPAINEINLELQSSGDYSSVVRVMDIRGQNILKISTDFVEGFNQLSIDISSLTNGKYYLVFDDKALPFIIQNR